MRKNSLKNALILLEVFFVFTIFFVLAASFILLSSTAASAQGNSITGYFIISSDGENKEIMINNSSDNLSGNKDAPAKAAGSSGRDSREPGLIRKIVGRVVSFFRGLF